ncbi:MAG: M23 family metallopeptidase [Patescibacteria group bacterium]|nr:M23 family metallopeptidase [Patescibacteria group bacterium]
MKKIIFAATVLAAATGLGIALFRHSPPPVPTTTRTDGQNNNPAINQNLTTGHGTTSPVTQTPEPGLAWPIKDALLRVTKKPFGIYITPKTSPVQPERFSGYHTGTDFETTAAEQNIDVPILTICAGKLLEKKYASGYGGVVVQSCKINGQPVTVVYGHLRLPSISATVGQLLAGGQQLAVLGTGYSQETDGERRHLHLGIHKGSSISILGYVPSKDQLAQWIDPIATLKQLN